MDAGTTQLLSVPYAIYADKAGMAKETAGGDRAGAVSTSAAGTGTVNFLTKFTAANTIYNSQVFDNGTNIGIGTTTPAATAKIHINQNSASILEHIRMQNLSATGAGRFTMYSDGPNNYSTFTKYGSGYAPGTGYAGISTLYPLVNLLAVGNNGLAANDGLGRFLISTAGNAGISLFKGGTSKLKFHADFTTENVGIGGNAAPVSRVHLNNTDGTTMDVRLTNNTTGHTSSDGLELRTTGNTARLMNRENAPLALGTRDTDRLVIGGSGRIGIATNTPTAQLDVNGQVRIRGGNPAAGKILTSDSNGTATWNYPASGAGLWLPNGNNIYNANIGGVSIGTQTPNSSAITEISSTTKGFLPPRMTLAQRNAINNPVEGLMIFNTTSGCPNYFSAGVWKEWCGSITGTISALNCAISTAAGTLVSGQPSNGVVINVPYSGGNGGQCPPVSISSNGVLGLTANNPGGGMFSNGSGNLAFTITGTPADTGIATFPLSIGGQTCNLAVKVSAYTYPPGTVFCNGTPTAVVEIYNPITGRIWMDRNLGASQAATSINDTLACGDLYQWGRGADGHQCRNSSTTTTLSSTDQPGHGAFILSSTALPYDWRSPQNNNLWQGVNGVNNPCPSAYRLPTDAELEAERTSWLSNYQAGAFVSPLKLPLAGVRSGSDGSLYSVGSNGIYWSSTVAGTNARNLYFNSGGAGMQNSTRADGYSVRCLKD
jgi:uncharacterized protein (TIGR02145 family)